MGLEGPIEDPNRGIDLAAALESDTVNVSVPSFAGKKLRGPTEGFERFVVPAQPNERETERVVKLRGLGRTAQRAAQEAGAEPRGEKSDREKRRLHEWQF